MATKNTKDNTYYSFTKAFRFSSIVVLIAPVLLIILMIVVACLREPPVWINITGNVVTIIAAVFALLWIILNIILFVMAGNMRGIKSPLGIRIALLIALVLVLSGAIVYSLIAFKVIPDIPNQWALVLAISLIIFEMAGYIIGAVLGKKIQKALKN